ncbi:MAG: hypothetical protein A2Z16_07955 [Chloroflexi bacterium RBG_16_54_18]|nr:MAG: hypothetical protein A2Z16_07955 [Chloroflexi bacterium RBG_16_54_18]
MLLSDAVKRDRTTARRVCLLQTLWQERYLTREQLISRVEGELGGGCFGDTAWKDAFYRDLRAVKAALSAAGYRLLYSRNPTRVGYYLRNQLAVGPELAKILDGSVAEVDAAQIAVLKGLAMAERFRLGFSISETAYNVVAYRIQQRNPALGVVESNRLALLQRERT